MTSALGDNAPAGGGGAREGPGADGGAAQASGETLALTPLVDVHRAAGARMVPFAGYLMPLQVRGIIAEHHATRTQAGLFDVSHMGQVDVRGGDAAAWLEWLTPSDISGLEEGAARYTVLTNEAGGVVDDLIVTRLRGRFRLVVNGARRAAVAEHFARHRAPGVTADFLDRALIAVQGPQAEPVLAPHVTADLARLGFMQAAETTAFGVDALVSRVGYTGEDGFEVSLPPERAAAAWQTLLDDGRASPVGLGARDTLRLEAGLCLYGQDLDETISPVEAGLLFVISKPRRTGGGFLGEERILREIAEGPPRRRVGLDVEGRVPVRAGAPIAREGAPVGTVTSGGVGPTVGRPVAMGLVAREAAEVGTQLEASVRGRPVAVTVARLPFVPARTKRKGGK